MSEKREDGMPKSADERKLRRMLGLHIGSKIIEYGGLYADDGEMSFSPRYDSPFKMFDFMRSSVEEIQQFDIEINKFMWNHLK